MSLPDDFLKAIGRITVNFSHLEFEVFFLIWPLLDSDQEAARVVSDMLSFRQKCELINSLCQLRATDKKEIEGLGDLTKKLDHVGLERNRLIHSVWAVGDTDAPVLSMGKKSSIKVTLQDLKKLGDLIAETSRQVTKFTSNVCVRFPGLMEPRKDPYRIVK